MTAVTIILVHAAFIDILTPVITLAMFIAVSHSKINPTWLILAGVLVGWLRFLVF